MGALLGVNFSFHERVMSLPRDAVEEPGGSALRLSVQGPCIDSHSARPPPLRCSPQSVFSCLCGPCSRSSWSRRIACVAVATALGLAATVGVHRFDTERPL